MRTGPSLMSGIGKAAVCRVAVAAALLVTAVPAEAEESRSVRVTVTVIDANKQPVGGAVVTITQDRWGPEMRPHDYRIETGADGIAVANVSLGELSWAEGRAYWPTFDIEATKGSNTARDRVKLTGARLSSGVRYPAEVSRTVTIKGAEVNVAVTVMGDDGKPVPGADVLISDSGAGGMGGARYRGATDGNGNVTIPVLLWERNHSIRASKEGYETNQVGITLDEKQLGRTMPATVTLKKGAATEATDVLIKVTREGTELPAADVAIKFIPTTGNTTGLYSATTNSSGEARLRIPGYGKFDVTLTQDTFEPLQTQVQLGYGEGEKTVNFSMKEKPTGEEEVTITVLAGDMKNGRGGFQPINGAQVQVGNLKAATDKNGTVTVDAKSGILETSKGQGYAEAVSVKASANGYKSQTRTVTIQRRGGAQGTGAATFVLEPGEDPVSDETPLTLLVEVTDASGPVRGAAVEFLSPGGEKLFGGSTDAKGQRDFSNHHAPWVELAALRRGITVQVKATGYRDHESSVPSDLLQPQKEARKYSVQLEKDWGDLAKALTEIEGRVNALRSEIRSQASKGESVKALAAKSIAARGRVENWLSELKAARKAFDTNLSGTNCEQAKELVKSIEALQREAAEKETALRKLLDEATGMVASCKTKAEGAAAAEKYRQAIKLAGEMRGLAPKASLANDKLKRFAEAMKDAGPLQAKLQETASNIQTELETVKKEANTANSEFNDAFSTNLNLPGKRAALVSDYAKLKASHKLSKDYDRLPKDLAARLERLDQVLVEGGADLSLFPAPAPDLTRIDEVIKPALAQIEKSKGEADTIVGEFKSALCTVQPLDAVVEQLGSLDTGNTIEISAVADLPARAQACGASASPTPTPTATPTPTPSPSATPTPTPTPSPSPSPSDEMVTVPSVTGAESIDYARTILNQAGFKSAFRAIKPKEKKDELTIAGTNPSAGQSAKRGSLVTVFIFQKWEPSPTPTPSSTPTPTVARGNVPDFTGLTLEQASSRLTSNMRIGGDEVGDAPPTPAQALTIFSQTPAPGSSFDPTKPLVITVKRYGSAQATLVQKFDGTYVGRYKGDDSGAVRFTVTDGTISIQTPGSGSGRISASGSASFSGAGRTSDSSFTFDGRFSVDAKGKATARGNWSGTQSGFSGSGTWSATRP